MLKSEEKSKSSTPAPVINTPEDRTDGDRDGTLNIHNRCVNTASVFKDRTKEIIYFYLKHLWGFFINCIKAIIVDTKKVPLDSDFLKN